ncbi:hypothetical protein [Phenylobacterium sp.]|uniref:hypothetical protein n=1 Tax=Phenylobacterium sp. TaxID=1871053 RepID=UPI002722DEC2|nr:hypothetical protein [Phenylobacterium sp.]MDO8800032.1 hypothetical protein [Phenylobacterium sp.]
MLSSEYITIGLAAVAAIVWLVRLEGRVNTGEKTDLANAATAAKADEELRREIAVVQAAQVIREAKHSEMNDNLIRMQEQLKYLTSLFERHFVEPPVPTPTTRRRTPQP